MKKILPVAATGIALLAFPLVAADAKPGKGKGGKHSAHSLVDGKGNRAAARKCSKLRKVGFAARGPLAAFSAEDVTITVAKANKHARSFIEGDSHTFALAGARVKFEGVTDADGSGTVDFADVVSTDVVKVGGKVARPKRGCDAESTVQVRKVHVERPAADEAEDSDSDDS